MRKSFRHTLNSLIVILLTALVAACSGGTEPGTQSEIVNRYIDEDRYEEALGVLEGQDPEDPAVLELLEKTHLNYGLHNMNTFDAAEMRTRMNDALRQFAAVLRINPGNDVARAQIEQILQVYETIPERQPEEDVIAELRELGFNP